MKSDPGRSEFYGRLNRAGLAPLWEVLGSLVTPEPRPASQPFLWKYSDVRSLLVEAGTRISAEEAERRVLVLENPGLRGRSQITGSLYAGVQSILPGETAPSHRHAASALRFVLESDGAYTAVNGHRELMLPGDFIVTPSWTFHDHGNPGSAPAIWLDGLDVPMVNLFDTSFFERDDVGGVKVAIPKQTFRYPYAASRAELDRSRQGGLLDPCHGFKMQYLNAETGKSPMPTIGAFLQLLPAGFRGAAYRSTDASVFCCVEGRGRSRIGDGVFEWTERDIFVVPSWRPVFHEALSDAVLFSFSDRPAQMALGLWREEVIPSAEK